MGLTGCGLTAGSRKTVMLVEADQAKAIVVLPVEQSLIAIRVDNASKTGGINRRVFAWSPTEHESQ